MTTSRQGAHPKDLTKGSAFFTEAPAWATSSHDHEASWDQRQAYTTQTWMNADAQNPERDQNI